MWPCIVQRRCDFVMTPVYVQGCQHAPAPRCFGRAMLEGCELSAKHKYGQILVQSHLQQLAHVSEVGGVLCACTHRTPCSQFWRAPGDGCCVDAGIAEFSCAASLAHMWLHCDSRRHARSAHRQSGMNANFHCGWMIDASGSSSACKKALQRLRHPCTTQKACT